MNGPRRLRALRPGSGTTSTGSAIIRRTATELAAAIASGETSAVEVTQACLDRIADVDETIHAFLYVDGERALDARRPRWMRRSLPVSRSDRLPGCRWR